MTLAERAKALASYCQDHPTKESETVLFEVLELVRDTERSRCEIIIKDEVGHKGSHTDRIIAKIRDEKLPTPKRLAHLALEMSPTDLAEFIEELSALSLI